MTRFLCAQLLSLQASYTLRGDYNKKLSPNLPTVPSDNCTPHITGFEGSGQGPTSVVRDVISVLTSSPPGLLLIRRGAFLSLVECTQPSHLAFCPPEASTSGPCPSHLTVQSTSTCPAVPPLLGCDSPQEMHLLNRRCLEHSGAALSMQWWA